LKPAREAGITCRHLFISMTYRSAKGENTREKGVFDTNLSLKRLLARLPMREAEMSKGNRKDENRLSVMTRCPLLWATMLWRGGSWTVDQGIGKNFRIQERIRVLFEAGAFHA
jgi:hypothetical protein